MKRFLIALLFFIPLPVLAADDAPPAALVHLTNACAGADTVPYAATVWFTNGGGSVTQPALALHGTNIGVTTDAAPPVAYVHITNIAGGADDAIPVLFAHAQNPPGCGAASFLLTQSGSAFLVATGSKIRVR